ncbi:DUF4173 domain-containing protein, partial [Nostoc sp. 3335mG]
MKEMVRMRLAGAARGSFAIKQGAAALLMILGSWLFYDQWIGATLGGLALAWLAALVVAVRPVRRSRQAMIAVLVALFFAVTLVDAPGLGKWTLFWTAIGSAALLSRRRFDDAFRWINRLVFATGYGLARPILDAKRLAKMRTRRRKTRIAQVAAVLALPVIGGAVFVALFAGANPLIGAMLHQVELASPLGLIPQAFVAGLIGLAVWPTLRPHPFATRIELRELSLGDGWLKVPPVSITLSLLTFNLIFALQNLSDIIFLWSGAPLPGQVTLADYAHRGAYSLIATALLAGLFVLTVLRPGSESAQRPAIRALVALWVAQNLLLVASSMLRTWDYVQAYSLTELRIAALVWMALVAVGLVLICWRLLAGKSSSWLINRNALAAGLVLAAGCATDLGAIAAHWNVRHAREVGGAGQHLDLCYLRQQGPSALTALAELETRVTAPVLLDRIRAVRSDILNRVEYSQSDWHSWTWRNARRLAAVETALGPKPAAPADMLHGRDCDGSPLPAPEPVPPEPAASPEAAAP